MANIRTIHVTTQEILTESGQPVNPPTVKVIATAVVKNPLAGKPLVKDLSELELMSAEVTALLSEKAVKALGALGLSANDVRGYGKGAIVGTDGELEHTAAVLHPRFGAPCQSETKMIVGNSTIWILQKFLSRMHLSLMKFLSLSSTALAVALTHESQRSNNV